MADEASPAPDTDEEARLLAESNESKAAANKLFGAAAFSEAVGEYDKAVSLLPDHLEYEIAVIKSNVAACHLKLAEWKSAAESATASLECLQRLLPVQEEPPPVLPNNKIEEIQPEENIGKPDTLNKQDATSNAQNQPLSEERRKQVLNIRSKSLFRRAKAYAEQGGWANLASAQKDYEQLSSMASLNAADRNLVRQQLRELGPKVDAAKEKEVGEMVGKLKDLGNGILKPFGLSTDMFKFQKDEKTGGYNMTFGDSGE